ncbi:MAG: hypothetical protein AAF539_06500 [Planctomycetota bacterium]
MNRSQVFPTILKRKSRKPASWMMLAVWIGFAPGINFLATDSLISSSVSAQELLQEAPESPADSSSESATDLTDPVVVVTLGSISQLTQDLNYLSGAIGTPQLGFTFAMMAGTFTQGIDSSQPIGVVVPLVDGTPEPMALIPAADVKSFLKTMEAQTGPADELDDGTLVIAIGANTVFIRQSGPWAVLARNRAVLDRAPADPGTLIGEMGRDYDIAIKLDVQKIPVSVRDALIGQLRQGFEQAMARQAADQADKANEIATSSLEQIEQVIGQTDELMFGIDIDGTNRRVVVDTAFTAVPGSSLADIYEGQRPITSQFASVVRDDAAMYLHAASTVSPETAEQLKSSLQSIVKSIPEMLSEIEELGETERTEAAEMIERIIDLVLESYGEGKVDLGVLMMADGQGMQLAIGSFVSEGDKAAQIVKDIADKVKGLENAPRFQFDIETYKDVTLHMMEADVPDDEEQVKKVFGDTIRIHIGTGPTSVYLALGDTSVPLLREMIDNAAATEDTVATGSQLAVAEFNLAPLLQFAKSIDSNDSIASMLDALARSDDLGQVKLKSDSIANGSKSRFVVGDGLIKALGTAYREAQKAKMQDAEF